MGQFKPMVKMMTTEPTVELKLKKGGTVKGHKNMKSGGCMKSGGKADATGHSYMNGGISAALAGAPMIAAPRRRMAAKVGKPSMAARRAAMMATGRKNGGAMEALKKHEEKPASKAHKGLKTGGVAMGQGGYKTGGVVKGQGGYKDGGIIKSESGKCKVNTAHPDTDKGPTGDVKLGKPAGYKKGGLPKKFAEGGSVQDDGRPQKMAQGAKKPSTAVSIDKLSGTFKKGGTVASKKLQAVFKKENAPAMKAAKADSDLKYSKYQKKMADGGYAGYDIEMSPEEQLKEMRRRKAMQQGYEGTRERDTSANEALLDTLTSLPKSVKDMVRKAMRGEGAVTDTETTVSRTVVPAKKRGGKV